MCYELSDKATEVQQKAVRQTKAIQTLCKSDGWSAERLKPHEDATNFPLSDGWSAECRKMHEGATSFPKKRRMVSETL